MRAKRDFGITTQKVLLLLMAGVALGLTQSPRRQFRILKSATHEWRQIDRRALHRAIRNLYESKLVGEKEDNEGNITLFLTDKGRARAVRYNLDSMEIKRPKKWDDKWRIVLFDIPERHKRARDALSWHLKELGLFRLQDSVFVHPFDCREEINFLAEFWGVYPFVRYVVADGIDNALDLEEKFKL